MASLELGKLSSYEILLSERQCDVYYARLTDSLFKTLEDYHQNKKGGQMHMKVHANGRGGIIQVAEQHKYNFKCSAISNSTGLDCLKQTRSSPELTVLGTAQTRLIIQATEDVYQATREKLILAEEKKNENQTVMLDFKNKRKLQAGKKTADSKPTPPPAAAQPPPSNVNKPPQRTLPTFKSSPTITDSKSQAKVRERAIHILALRPHRKPELLSKLSDNGSKSKDNITRILGQVAAIKNNMYHLKAFLYGEVQIDTWPEYSDSDRAAIRQQLKIQDTQVGKPGTDDTPTTDISSSQGDAAKVTESKVDPKSTTKPQESVVDKRADRSRKRSSCDAEVDRNSTKKQCRGKGEGGKVNGEGVECNAKSRKAAEDLKLPFIENVQKEISRIQLKFVKIETEEQKLAYATEFEKDYEEYLKLKKREKEIGVQFEELKSQYEKAEKKTAEVRAINRKARELFKQYATDPSWCEDKEKLMKLEAKLSHIKFIFKEYDKSAAG